MGRADRAGLKDWTIVLPVRDTDEEFSFLFKVIPAAIKLGPAEIIIGLDYPASQRIVQRVEEIAKKKNYVGKLQFVVVEKTSDWHFPLAKVVWQCYKAAHHDRIFSFDVDSVPVSSVLEGLDKVGVDNIAIYSFTKRLRINNMSDLIRHIFYRIRVMRSEYVFSGCYWVYRPFFFDTVDEHEYRDIYNGVDTYLTAKILREGKYRIVTSKKIGVKCMTLQNEDYPWRQFQVGIWLGADDFRWFGDMQKRREIRKMRNDRNPARKIASNVLHFPLWDLDTHMVLYVYVRSFMYQHPYLIKGYKWAKANPLHEVVKQARQMDLNTWQFQGGKLMSKIEGLQLKGTGAATRP